MDLYDDVHDSRWLDRNNVIAARRLEIDFFQKLGVYEHVHKSTAKGHKIITTRWIDTNKGDSEHPYYRSILVGREIKNDARLDLFAPTSPLEVMKIILSKCA